MQVYEKTMIPQRVTHSILSQKAPCTSTQAPMQEDIIPI